MPPQVDYEVDHDLESVAYHEAGHAVIAIEFGWQVTEVRIELIPHSERRVTSYSRWRGVTWYSDSDVPPTGETARICVYMAGLLAEEKFCGSGRSFSGKNVFKHFQALCRGEKEQDSSYGLPSDLRQVAMELYDEDTTEASIIAAVAHYREATNALLNNPRIWADVTKVAKALLQRRRLGARAVKKCLGVSIPRS
jgi:ATP-dependent Zn protease